MTTDPTAFLMAGSCPSAKFPKIGASVTGTICEPPTVGQQTDMETGELKFWKDGKPMEHLVVTLQTEEHDSEIEDDDGKRRIYIKFNMKTAIADAVRKSGAKALEVGGKLTVTHTSVGQPTAKGFSPPKFYSAEYVPAADSFLENGDPSDEFGSSPPPSASLVTAPVWPTFDAALAYVIAETKGKLTKAEVGAALKADGHTTWNPVTCSPIVKKLVDEFIPF